MTKSGAVQEVKTGPLPLTMKCDCTEWAASEDMPAEIKKGYSFVCPDCGQALQLVKSCPDRAWHNQDPHIKVLKWPSL